jgi:cytochrome d ubiquinol oxidase subunit II
LTSEGEIIAVPVAVGLALLSGWAVVQRRFRLARAAAAAEVALLLAGWALSQYPYLVPPDLTYRNAAATPALMRAALIVFIVGALFLAPSLWFLYRVFKADLPGEVESGSGPARTMKL